MKPFFRGFPSPVLRTATTCPEPSKPARWLSADIGSSRLLPCHTFVRVFFVHARCRVGAFRRISRCTNGKSSGSTLFRSVVFYKIRIAIPPIGSIADCSQYVSVVDGPICRISFSFADRAHNAHSLGYQFMPTDESNSGICTKCAFQWQNPDAIVLMSCESHFGLV